MDEYETDEILSQALDLAEDVENDIIFITQSTFHNNEGSEIYSHFKTPAYFFKQEVAKGFFKECNLLCFSIVG
jgi:hypothetical protein